MNYYGDHTLRKMYCPVCGQYTEHEDGVCDADMHERNFLQWVADLPGNEERLEFLMQEEMWDKEDALEYLLENSLLYEDDPLYENEEEE